MNRLKHLPDLLDNRLLRNGGAAFLAAGAIAGCGNGNSNTQATITETVPAPASAPAVQGPHGRTPQELATSIAQLSRNYRGQGSNVPSEFCGPTNDHPQRMYSRKPARLIVNSLCQPPLGEPVGVYSLSAFHKDNPKSQKEGEVHDGDVVEALCIDKNGERTYNVLGDSSASDTWVKIKKGRIEGMVSEVNLGYVNDALFKEC